MSKARDTSKKKLIFLLVLLVIIVSLITTATIFYGKYNPQKESGSSIGNVFFYVKDTPEPQSSLGIVKLNVVNNERGE